MQKMYPGKLAGKIGEGNYLVIREFNQPKLNIMCHKLLEIERVVALFVKEQSCNKMSHFGVTIHS